MIESLRATCRRLLETGTVQVVIGYGQAGPGKAVHPVFIRRPEDTDQLTWNDQCYPNLATYLKRKEIQSLGKAAIVVKGCDERALVVLEKESQIDRNSLYVIGIACDGVGNPKLGKCKSCDAHCPRFANETLGESSLPQNNLGQKWQDLEQFLTKSPSQRMAYWQDELSRCLKCYACRQVCPMCYCERCLVDKNRPTCIDTSPTLKGNFAWHITRAFHLAGRCIGCGECTRACPVGIDLRLLNQSLAKAAEEQFGYRAGMDPQAESLIGSYSLQDKDGFIG
jgi:formate dehydrogenase subunit beta